MAREKTASSEGLEGEDLWNVANQLTFFRVFLVFASIYLLALPSNRAKVCAVLLIPLLFALDGADGYIARKYNAQTRFGSFLDVFADRVTETAYLLFFLSEQLVPLWAVLVVVVRGLLTDAVRAQALSLGKTVYSMMESNAGKSIVAGRFMRALVGGVKAALFTSLAVEFAFDGAWLAPLSYYLMLAFVAINLARGYPVLAEGAKFSAR
jgi:CDP-diacylglycerol---glycerol-3-phosphate 3-phosphatidyltransferase